MSEEVRYLLVVVGLFIVPRALQRARIPSAVTCVALGAVLGMGFGLFAHDNALPLLAMLGIVALFLFAGLEVDLEELRRGLSVTIGHLALQLFLLAVSTPLLASVFSLELRPSLLLALALLTPSTGFILDSLPAFGLTPQQQFWVKTKAIASEIVALGALFLVVQSSSVLALGTSLLALGAMILVLPYVFQVFAVRVLPFAPKSEFTFLLILALICAYLTRHLGVYYLVGAFVVGVTAVRMRKRLPELASPRLLIGIELFASFFVPFYFFKAGLHLETRYFTWRAILLGLAFVVLAVPLRVGLGSLVRRLLLGESMREGLRVGLSLTPTLVFTLVLADILRERFALGDALYGALVVFALLTTVLPGFFLRSMPEFAAPEVPKPLSMAPAPGPDMANASPAPEAPDRPDNPSVAEGV